MSERMTLEREQQIRLGAELALLCTEEYVRVTARTILDLLAELDDTRKALLLQTEGDRRMTEAAVEMLDGLAAHFSAASALLKFRAELSQGKGGGCVTEAVDEMRARKI